MKDDARARMTNRLKDAARVDPRVVGIEQAVTPARLKQLDACIPAADPSPLIRSFVRAAALGYEVCESVAARHGWPWPRVLAVRTLALLDDAGSLHF